VSVISRNLEIVHEMLFQASQPPAACINCEG
jgi:hypothetical protein